MRKWNLMVIFAVAALGAGVVCAKEAKLAEPARQIVAKIVSQPPREMEFIQRIQVQGNVESQEAADISNRIGGNLDVISVGEGSRVKTGDMLFQVDRLTLENNVKGQVQKVEVAAAEYRIAMINCSLAETVAKKAKIDYDRAVQLKSSHAISEDAFERAKLNYDEAGANVAKAEAQANYAKAKVEQEKVGLEIAEKNLSDSMIRAPFNGVVIAKDMDAGEFAQPGTKILRLENPDRLELVTMISAIYYSRIVVGETRAVIKHPGGNITLPVTFRSPAVDPLSRTFSVKIELPKDSGFVSGELCEVDLILSKQTGMGIPNEAVLTRANNRKAVFVVAAGNTAEEVTIQTGLTDGPWTMLLDPEVLKGRPVIIEGQAFLENGDKVENIGEGK